MAEGGREAGERQEGGVQRAGRDEGPTVPMGTLGHSGLTRGCQRRQGMLHVGTRTQGSGGGAGVLGSEGWG